MEVLLLADVAPRVMYIPRMAVVTDARTSIGSGEPLIDLVVERLTREFKLALHDAGPNASLGGLLEALAAGAARALCTEGIGAITTCLDTTLDGDVVGAYDASTGVLSVNPDRVRTLPGAWNLADCFRAELAAVVEVVAHQVTHAWQGALLARLLDDRLSPIDLRRSLAARVAADVLQTGPDAGPGTRTCGVDPRRWTEQIATVVGRRVARGFAGWFGGWFVSGPGRAPVHYGPRLHRLALGESARKRLASSLAVTLASGERRHLEVRLLLTEWGDALAAMVLDCRRGEALDRAGQSEVDVAMDWAVRIVGSAAREAGFERVAWSWAMRGAFPPVSFGADQELGLPLGLTADQGWRS